MAQFDVYDNPASSRDRVPYLLDVQHDLLEMLATRVVVPLVAEAHAGRPAKVLNPVFEVEGVRVVMSTPELAGVTRDVLGPRVDSLAGERSRVIAAIDILLSGV